MASQRRDSEDLAGTGDVGLIFGAGVSQRVRGRCMRLGKSSSSSSSWRENSSKCVPLVALLLAIIAIGLSATESKEESTEGIVILRGATTAVEDSQAAIHDAAEEMVREMLRLNNAQPSDISEGFFSMTPDLSAAFPATVVRTRIGAQGVPLFGMLEAQVDGAPIRCIRALVRVRSKISQSSVKMAYLRGAAQLQARVPGASGSPQSVDSSFGDYSGVGVGAGHAGTSGLDVVRRRGVLLVGTTGDYPPFTTKCNSTQNECIDGWGGCDVVMISRMARDLGVRVQYVETSWGGLKKDMVQLASFDVAVGGVTDTLPRRIHVAFSSAVYYSGKTAVFRCGTDINNISNTSYNRSNFSSDAPFETLQGLGRHGVRIGVNPGGTNEVFVLKNKGNATVVVLPQGGQEEALLRGQVDVVVTDSIEAQLNAARHKGVLCVKVTPPWTREGKAWMLPRGDVAMKAFVDSWLDIHKDAYAEALTEWFRRAVLKP